LGLSDTFTRSGEWGSPKRGQEEWLCVPYEMVWLLFQNIGNYMLACVGFGLEGLSPVRV